MTIGLRIECLDESGVVVADLLDADVVERIGVRRGSRRRCQRRRASRERSARSRLEANSSSHGAQAAEWIHRPWMKTTGVVAMMHAPSVSRWSVLRRLVGLEVLRQSAVDEEVGTGDVAGAVAREQQDEVGDLFGLGEASGGEAARRLR